MLLEILAKMDCFRSLTYRDMPFVMAPNFWQMLSRHSQLGSQRIERAHGDGMMVDFDSPESFEEIFWHAFSKNDLTSAKSYDLGPIDSDVLEAFADFRSIVASLRRKSSLEHIGNRRYLSKNNNNLLRLRELSADPTASILLVFRDPVATARSLHRLHLRFCAGDKDKFSRKYMKWLGHYEFGPDHLPFSFALPFMRDDIDPATPDYWLSYWCAIHLFVLEQKNLRLKLISHDMLRITPKVVLSKMFSFLNLKEDVDIFTSQVRPPDSYPKAATEFSSELLEAAWLIFGQLSESEMNLCKADMAI